MGKITSINNTPMSALAYGCACDKMLAGEDNSIVLDASVEAGINLFDTGRTYGNSEASLGRWIKDRRNREDIVVLSKCCHPLDDKKDRVNAAAIRADLDESLKFLNSDYIDIYLLHRDEINTPVAELIDALEDERKKGKIRYYGVSNWTLDRFKEANAYAESVGAAGFSVNSPNFSLAEQIEDPWQVGSSAISISGAANKKERDYYEKEDITIISYSSLARGLFSGKFTSKEADKASCAMDSFAMRGFFSEENIKCLARVEEMAAQKGVTVPEIALAYLLNQKLEVHPIVTYTNPERAKNNAGALKIKLTESELAYLEG